MNCIFEHDFECGNSEEEGCWDCPCFMQRIYEMKRKQLSDKFDLLITGLRLLSE